MGLLSHTFVIISRLVEFVGRVDRVNGNRLCAKSERMASLERVALRLTRGNDPEERVLSTSLYLPARARLRSGVLLSVVMSEKHRSFRPRQAFSRSKVENRDVVAVIEDTAGQMERFVAKITS